MGVLSWLVGFAVGYGIGYAAGRLYAPTSGEQVRLQLKVRYQEIADEAEKAAEDKRRELEARYEVAKRTGATPI